MIRQITAPDDSGNIIVHEVSRNIATLSIRPDKAGGWAQWFYFEVSGTPDTCCELRIIDTGDCSYPEGWVDYRACVSEDGAWMRTETDYDGKTLTIRHRLVNGEAKFAYFEPYPLSRHRDQMRRIGDRWPVNTLGISLGGNSIDRIRIGDGGFQIWLLGRQHSGETMASWWMDGVLDQLEAEADLLEQATIHIVPLVNPDGA
jgi:murein tripeptide amidase MpaA